VRTRCSPANSLLCRFLLYLVLAAVLIFAVRSLCWVISLEVRPSLPFCFFLFLNYFILKMK